MGRPANRCKRCSGPQRGRSGRTADIVAYCRVCGDGVCARHLTWNDGWVCSKCEREGRGMDRTST